MKNIIEKVNSWVDKYIIVRTYASGVHFGILKEYDPANRHVLLNYSRRIWYWEGAFTLSAIATNGIKTGKLSVVLPEIIISEVIELIPCSETGVKSLSEMKAFEPEY